MIGFDANDDEIQDLKDGTVDGLIVQNPFGMGYATVVAAARASLDMGNEAVVNTGYTWVTKENLKTDEVQKILYNKIKKKVISVNMSRSDFLFMEIRKHSLSH